MTNNNKNLIAIMSALSASIGVAHAGVIVSAVDATASSVNGDGFEIENTIDQSGLSAGYTSGVTDFDTYIASDPIHTSISKNMEWFTRQEDFSATIDYDLGSTKLIDALALWNEEFSGFGEGKISWSLNGSDFFLLTIINPVDSPAGQDYGAQVFGFAETLLRYLRFEISNCPQPDGGVPALFCGIGEVAFRVSDGNVGEVPIPGAIPLFLAGLAGLQLRTRRQRKS